MFVRGFRSRVTLIKEPETWRTAAK